MLKILFSLLKVADITTDDDDDDLASACLTQNVATCTDDDEIKEFRIETNVDLQMKILESNSFHEFITKKIGVLEKALDQDDIFYDYGVDLETTE